MPSSICFKSLNKYYFNILNTILNAIMDATNNKILEMVDIKVESWTKRKNTPANPITIDIAKET